MGTLKLIQPFIKKYKYNLLVYSICVLIAYPLESIFLPKLFSSFFDELNKNVSKEVFIKYLLYFVGFIFITANAQLITNKMDSFLIPTFNESIANTFFKKILEFYENNYADLELGKLQLRINYLPSILREVTTDLFNWVIPKILTIIIVNYYFFTQDTMFGLISITSIFIILFFNLFYFNECIALSNDRYDNFEFKSEQLQDKLSNLSAIYSSGTLNDEINEFEKINKNFKEKHINSMKCNQKIKNMNSILWINIIFIVLCVYIVYIYYNNKIDKKQLVSLFMMLIFYIPSLNSVVTYIPDYTHHLGIINGISDYVDMIHTPRIDKPDIFIKNGNILIKNLNFSYNKDKTLFSNFNLSIKAGEKVAIIGPSGNGKSTLIKLILGYYKISDETMFIDGLDINKHNLVSLRKQITYLNQNTKLFNKSVFENINYGNNINKEDIYNLYKKYDLEKIFNNIPNGLDYIVGVNGESLSGGQKQIVLLLRNYFKDNKIIILDEPTAALDNNSRIVVLKIIKDMSIKSTLIVITHDMKNLELINREIILEGGKIKSDKRK
jgi:ABC-type multidrug transport system fused ATPase/permease subunit